MSWPIASRELVKILRRRNTFLLVGGYYSVLTLAAAAVWGTIEFSPMNRAEAGEGLFWVYLISAFLFLTVHGTMQTSHTLVDEIEGKTAAFLRIAPVRSTSILMQKLVAPAVTEWLFFLGAMPFVSLVFFLGGVSGPQFLNQMINLAFWLNTCLALGLYVSSRSRRGDEADRFSLGLLFFICALLPILVEALIAAGGFADLAGIGDLVFYAEAWATAALNLTPWRMKEAVEVWVKQPPLTAEGGHWLYPGWVSIWGGHLLIQGILVILAFRRWNRERERGEEVGDGLTRKGLFGRTLYTAPRGLYPDLEQAFYELEDRRVFKGGRRTKGRLAAGAAVLFLAGAATLAGSQGEVREMIAIGGQVVLVCFGGLSLLFLVSQAGNSYKREIQGHTADLFLEMPLHPRDAFRARWFYYMKLGFWVTGVVVAMQLALFALSIAFLGFPSNVQGEILLFVIADGTLICLVPVLSFLGLLSGLFGKVNNGALLGIFFLLLFGASCLWFLFFLIPFGLAIGNLMSLAPDASRGGFPGGIQGRYVESGFMTILRGVAFWLLLLLTMLDLILLAVLMSNDSVLGIGPGAVGYIVFLNLTLLPLGTALSLWYWIVGFNLIWWRRKLQAREAYEEPGVPLPAPAGPR